MKYVRIMRGGAAVWGVLEGDTVRTLSKPPFGSVEYDGGSLALAECVLLAPCEPTKIVCIGKNYFDHVQELKDLGGAEPPAKPILFLKAPNALNHPEGSVHAPEFAGRLDYEGELAFVIKRRAKNVKEKDFADYILGYTCLNDVTARDVQYADGQWTRGKGMDGFAPVGPLVTDEIDALHADIVTRLNGREVQRGNSAQQMHPIPELLAFITDSMTLEPGDVVTTGTPAGIGPMEPGDVVEVEIPGVGILRNHVV